MLCKSVSSCKINCKNFQVLHPPNPFTLLTMFRTLLLCLTVVVSQLPSGVLAYRKKCVFPTEWQGEWFLMGAPNPVKIEESAIDFKGHCLESDVDTYLIKEPVKGQNCFRCLVIHQKHENILQYKESECGYTSNLEQVCNLLSGDSKLHSMFRLNAQPVACPFPHSYTFEYNNGRGLCSNPPSTVHSCTEPWRLIFQYQACPDVRGSERKVEKMTCLGVWKEGSKHYFVGFSDQERYGADRYRCFAYAPSGGIIEMAKSGDSSCLGLFSLYGGDTTFKMKKVETRGSRCHFPIKFNEWRSLDGKGKLHITRKNTTLRYTGHGSDGPVTYTCFHVNKSLPKSSTYDSRNSNSYYSNLNSRNSHEEYEVAATHQRKEEVLGYFVSRVSHGCTSGFKCIKILERDHHILELLMGKLAQVADEACGHHFFDDKSNNYSTYISSNAETRQCPSMGRYDVIHDMAIASVMESVEAGAAPGNALIAQRDLCRAPYTTLSVGCSASDKLEMHTSCSNSVYSCHGWWKDTVGRQFLVVTPASRTSTGARRLCLVIEGDSQGGSGHLTVASSTGYCSRIISPERRMHIYLNISSSGACETLAASATSGSPIPGGVLLSKGGYLGALTIIATLTSSILTTACLLSSRQQF